MDGCNKRRVAHVGQHISKKKSKVVNDVVTSIMEQMDVNIAESGNQEFCEIVNTTTRRKPANKKNLTVPSQVESNMAVPQSKKFLSTKRHPLMEKAQKNIKFIKHNRSMPKPRAHLGGMREVTSKQSEVNIVKSSSSHSKKVKKTSEVPARRKLNNSSYSNNTISDESVSDASSKRSNKLPVLSSDSEAEYENFIQSQKQDIAWNRQNISKGKKMNNPKKDKRKSKTLKQNKSEKKLGEKKKLEEFQNFSPGSSKICSKSTSTNRLKLPDTSDSADSSSDEIEPTHMVSSSDENEPSNSMHKIVEESSVPSVEKENDGVEEGIDESTDVMEPNPQSEEIVASLNTTFNNDNYQTHELTEIQLDEKKIPSEIILDSDDECTIVWEDPKYDNHNDDICIADGSDKESDIQILNVISLNENPSGIDTNDKETVSKYPINYEILKEAVKFATSVNKTSIPEDNKPNFLGNTSNSTANVDYDSVATDILETAKNIDFKKILLLTNNECNKSHFESSSSINDSPSFASLPSGDPVIAEDHWQNIEKAVRINGYFQNEFRTTSELLKSNGINNFKGESCEDQVDVFEIDTLLNICPSPHNLMKLQNLYSRALQDIKSTEEQCTSGLKMFREMLTEKKSKLETTFKHIMEHDPCFYTTTGTGENTFVINDKKRENYAMSETSTSLEQVKKCVKCGRCATIECEKCHKVFFCARECGVSYWENGHYKECEGLLKK